MHIHAKRKGIFEVDLRLRPYGKAGSLAVSLETFRKYFSPDGPAWPYERQALVKLRPVAGDAEFGRQMIDVRDRVDLHGPAVRCGRDAGNAREAEPPTRPRGDVQREALPGGLVDCEYLVQGLQITYGASRSGPAGDEHPHRDEGAAERRDPGVRSATFGFAMPTASGGGSSTACGWSAATPAIWPCRRGTPRSSSSSPVGLAMAKTSPSSSGTWSGTRGTSWSCRSSSTCMRGQGGVRRLEMRGDEEARGFPVVCGSWLEFHRDRPIEKPDF